MEFTVEAYENEKGYERYVVLDSHKREIASFFREEEADALAHDMNVEHAAEEEE